MDPEYLSGSPTVMAYDYANGSYFAPAAYGQQTPAQAAFAAVRAADPILASMPATAPLVGHPVPNYPRQGHVPVFTSPMNAGEWNIRGVDMPTYAPALPPMPGSDWRTFPQPIDGRQLSPARPQFSAFAGVDYGAAKIDYSRPGFGRSREVQDGGYRYRQFADGAVMILVSERPDLLAPGTILTANNPADPNYRRWVAITTKIGAWKDYAQARTAAALDAGTSALRAASPRRKKRRKRATATIAPPPLPEGTPLPPTDMLDEETPETNYTPWLIGGAVAVVGIFALVLLSGGSKRGGRGKE
jgi:hypothetical protein